MTLISDISNFFLEVPNFLKFWLFTQFSGNIEHFPCVDTFPNRSVSFEMGLILTEFISSVSNLVNVGMRRLSLLTHLGSDR